METAVEAGPYAFAINTAQTGAVTAADATRPRVDIVWVRLDDPAESDGSSVPAVVAGYTAGAPLAGSPVAPATPARCMVLATLQVPMSGGGSPTVIWVAPCTVAAGAPIPVANQAARGALTPYDGLRIYRLDLHCVQTYNGTQWLTTDSFIGADASMVFGTALTDWDPPEDPARLHRHSDHRLGGVRHCALHDRVRSWGVVLHDEPRRLHVRPGDGHP